MESYNFEDISRVAMEEHFLRKQSKDSTKVFYYSMMNKVIAALGDTDIRTIDAAMIQKFLNTAAINIEGKPVSRRVVGAWMTIFRITFKYAIRNHIIGLNPMATEEIFIPNVAEEPFPDDRFLTDAQIKIALQAVADNRLYITITKALLFSGLRIGELLALNKGDLVPERNIVRVCHSMTKAIVDGKKVKYVVGDTKTKASRRNVYVSSIFFDVINSWMGFIKNDKRHSLAVEKGNHAYVFVNKNGDLFNYATLQHNYRRYLYQHDVHFRVTFHMLRHCYVSYMLDQDGIKIEDISRQIGHRSIKTTCDIYFSQTEKAQKQLVAASTETFKGFLCL